MPLALKRFHKCAYSCRRCTRGPILDPRQTADSDKVDRGSHSVSRQLFASLWLWDTLQNAQWQRRTVELVVGVSGARCEDAKRAAAMCDGAQVIAGQRCNACGQQGWRWCTALVSHPLFWITPRGSNVLQKDIIHIPPYTYWTKVTCSIKKGPFEFLYYWWSQLVTVWHFPLVALWFSRLNLTPTCQLFHPWLVWSYINQATKDFARFARWHT